MKVLITILATFNSISWGNDQRTLFHPLISSCHRSICMQISTTRGFQSTWGESMIAFEGAELKIVNIQNDKTLARYSGSDGLIDLDTQTVTLRTPNNKAHRELLYNLKTNKMMFF